MKLGPVTKLDKRNKTTSNKLDDGVMSVNYDVIVIFPIYGQAGFQTHKSVKLTLSLLITFYLTKTENRTKKSLIHFSRHCFE